ncbi:MAG: GNAT family N-acetyltransferase [Promethearchaeota archaeon]
MQDYVIQRFDIADASQEDWGKFHRYRRKRSSEVFPGDPVEEDVVYEEWARTSLEETDIKCYAAVLKADPSEMVAWLRMSVFRESSPSYPGNKHLVRVNLAVLKEHRRKGIGLSLLKRVYEFAKEHKKSVIIGSTTDEEGRDLNHKIGGTEALEMRVYRLSLDEVDWKMVERWNREGAERSPDASLEFFESIPDEILEDYCEKYTEVYNQMPLDELDVGDLVYTPELVREYEETCVKSGETWLKAILQEKNGDISGMTDVVYHPSKAPLLTQILTGVDEKYRGHGKGKWVKAAMLLKVREKFPDIGAISTSNATSNTPMISINERLGFKLHLEAYNLQIDTEKLGAFLEGK